MIIDLKLQGSKKAFATINADVPLPRVSETIYCEDGFYDVVQVIHYLYKSDLKTGSSNNSCMLLLKASETRNFPFSTD